MTKLKIVSDGTPAGTKVFTEDGKQIEGVYFISWEIDAGSLPRATISVHNVPVELVSEFTVDSTL